MQTEIAPVSPERSPGTHAPVAASERVAASRSPLRRLRAALRFDGLWWRKIARLGAVYGPEWWSASRAAGRCAHHLPPRRSQPSRGDREPDARTAGRGALGRHRRRVSDVRLLRILHGGDHGVLRSTSQAPPHRRARAQPRRRSAGARARRDPGDGARRQLGRVGKSSPQNRTPGTSGDGPRAQRNDAGIFPASLASKPGCT